MEISTTFVCTDLDLSKIQIKSIADGDQQVAKDTLVGSWKMDEEVSLKLEQPIKQTAHERIAKFLLKAFKSPADQATLDLYTEYFDRQYEEKR